MAAECVADVCVELEEQIVPNECEEESQPSLFFEILMQLEQKRNEQIQERVKLLINGWTVLVSEASNLPEVSEAFYSLFRETAHTVFRTKWKSVEDSMKQQIIDILVEGGNKLNNLVDGALHLSSSLIETAKNPWGDAILKKILKGEIVPSDAGAKNYLLSQPKLLLLAQVEFLVGAGHEDAALRLCQGCLKSHWPPSAKAHYCREGDYPPDGGGEFDGISGDNPCSSGKDVVGTKQAFWIWMLRILYRKNLLHELARETNQCMCHDGVQLIHRIKDGSLVDSQELAETLTHLFLVRDLLYPSTYCCTKELISLWCGFQVAQQRSLEEISVAARKLLVLHASTSAHFYLFVDILWMHFGSDLLPLYLEMYIRGLTCDLNYLEEARYDEDYGRIEELKCHIASVFSRLASLFMQDQKEVARECVISAFSMDPTHERMELLRQLTELIALQKMAAGIASNRNPGGSQWQFVNQNIGEQLDGQDARLLLSYPRYECRCGRQCSSPTEEIEFLKTVDKDELPSFLYPFSHPVIDAKIEGVSSELLKDFATVLECMRYNLLRGRDRWEDMRESCEEYLETALAMKTMLQYNNMYDSADSETDSPSEDEEVSQLVGPNEPEEPNEINEPSPPSPEIDTPEMSVVRVVRGVQMVDQTIQTSPVPPEALLGPLFGNDSLYISKKKKMAKHNRKSKRLKEKSHKRKLSGSEINGGVREKMHKKKKRRKSKREKDRDLSPEHALRMLRKSEAHKKHSKKKFKQHDSLKEKSFPVDFLDDDSSDDMNSAIGMDSFMADDVESPEEPLSTPPMSPQLPDPRLSPSSKPIVILSDIMSSKRLPGKLKKSVNKYKKLNQGKFKNLCRHKALKNALQRVKSSSKKNSLKKLLGRKVPFHDAQEAPTAVVNPLPAPVPIPMPIPEASTIGEATATALNETLPCTFNPQLPDATVASSSDNNDAINAVNIPSLIPPPPVAPIEETEPIICEKAPVPLPPPPPPPPPMDFVNQKEDIMSTEQPVNTFIPPPQEVAQQPALPESVPETVAVPQPALPIMNPAPSPVEPAVQIQPQPQPQLPQPQPQQPTCQPEQPQPPSASDCGSPKESPQCRQPSPQLSFLPVSLQVAGGNTTRQLQAIFVPTGGSASISGCIQNALRSTENNNQTFKITILKANPGILKGVPASQGSSSTGVTNRIPIYANTSQAQALANAMRAASEASQSGSNNVQSGTGISNAAGTGVIAGNLVIPFSALSNIRALINAAGAKSQPGSQGGANAPATSQQSNNANMPPSTGSRVIILKAPAASTTTPAPPAAQPGPSSSNDAPDGEQDASAKVCKSRKRIWTTVRNTHGSWEWRKVGNRSSVEFSKPKTQRMMVRPPCPNAAIAGTTFDTKESPDQREPTVLPPQVQSSCESASVNVPLANVLPSSPPQTCNSSLTNEAPPSAVSGNGFGIAMDAMASAGVQENMEQCLQANQQIKTENENVPMTKKVPAACPAKKTSPKKKKIAPARPKAPLTITGICPNSGGVVSVPATHLMQPSEPVVLVQQQQPPLQVVSSENMCQQPCTANNSMSTVLYGATSTMASTPLLQQSAATAAAPTVIAASQATPSVVNLTPVVATAVTLAPTVLQQVPIQNIQLQSAVPSQLQQVVMSEAPNVTRLPQTLVAGQERAIQPAHPNDPNAHSRSLSSISDAVRVSLMMTDENSGGLENQISSAYQPYPQQNVVYPAPDASNSLTANANGMDQNISGEQLLLPTAFSVPQAMSLPTSEVTTYTSQTCMPSTTTWSSPEIPLISGGQNEMGESKSKSKKKKKSKEGPEGEHTPDSKTKKKKKSDKEHKEDPDSHKWWCEPCSRGFFSAYNLRRHQRNVHKMDCPSPRGPAEPILSPRLSLSSDSQFSPTQDPSQVQMIIAPSSVSLETSPSTSETLFTPTNQMTTTISCLTPVSNAQYLYTEGSAAPFTGSVQQTTESQAIQVSSGLEYTTTTISQVQPPHQSFQSSFCSFVTSMTDANCSSIQTTTEDEDKQQQQQTERRQSLEDIEQMLLDDVAWTEHETAASSYKSEQPVPVVHATEQLLPGNPETYTQNQDANLPSEQMISQNNNDFAAQYCSFANKECKEAQVGSDTFDEHTYCGDGLGKAATGTLPEEKSFSSKESQTVSTSNCSISGSSEQNICNVNSSYGEQETVSGSLEEVNTNTNVPRGGNIKAENENEDDNKELRALSSSAANFCGQGPKQEPVGDARINLRSELVQAECTSSVGTNLNENDLEEPASVPSVSSTTLVTAEHALFSNVNGKRECKDAEVHKVMCDSSEQGCDVSTSQIRDSYAGDDNFASSSSNDKQDEMMMDASVSSSSKDMELGQFCVADTTTTSCNLLISSTPTTTTSNSREDAKSMQVCSADSNSNVQMGASQTENQEEQGWTSCSGNNNNNSVNAEPTVSCSQDQVDKISVLAISSSNSSSSGNNNNNRSSRSTENRVNQDVAEEESVVAAVPSSSNIKSITVNSNAQENESKLENVQEKDREKSKDEAQDQADNEAKEGCSKNRDEVVDPVGQESHGRTRHRNTSRMPVKKNCPCCMDASLEILKRGRSNSSESTGATGGSLNRSSKRPSSSDDQQQSKRNPGMNTRNSQKARTKQDPV